jgi:hypothetical protein
MVEPPTAEQLEQIDIMTSGLVQLLSEVDMSSGIKMPDTSALETALASLGNAKIAELGFIESFICGVAGVSRALKQGKEAFKEDIQKGGHGSEAITELRKAQRSRIVSDDDDYLEMPTQNPTGRAPQRGHSEPVYGRAPINAPDMVPAEDSSAFKTISVFAPQGAAQSGFAHDVFANDRERSHRVQNILNHADDDSSMLDYEETFSGVKTIEEQLGASPEQAGAAARGVVQGIESATRYPQSIPPDKSSPEISGMLESLIESLDDQ